MRDIEYSTVVSDTAAFRDYTLEPDRKIEARILNNVTMLPMILIDMSSPRQDQQLVLCRLLSAGRKKNPKELRTGNGSLRNDLQVLSVEPELLTALRTITPIALNDLARSLQFKPGVEEFAALGAHYSLRTQFGAEAS